MQARASISLWRFDYMLKASAFTQEGGTSPPLELPCARWDIDTSWFHPSKDKTQATLLGVPSVECNFVTKCIHSETKENLLQKYDNDNFCHKINTFCLKKWHLHKFLHTWVQWNLVITRTLGPWKLPCYNRFLIISWQKNQRNIKSWDQQNYVVIRGFCYIRPLYNEVPLYLVKLGQTLVGFELNWSIESLAHIILHDQSPPR